MKIIEGKPQPVPLDRIELSPAEVYEALRAYVLTHTGRTAHEIVGAEQIHGLGQIYPSYAFTLTLKSESK
jgi:hypothetical protein